MSAPATIPFAAPRTSSQPWTPSDRDRLIFQWVKFEGHTQSWVAQQLEMNQSSVSRIIERYERWIARGGPAHAGGLDNDERRRAQRWLTYERNEWILTSALRIAGEMEQALDTSKSTVSHPASHPSREIEVRTEHKVIDRSGIAARFLRLAHRVNMDQLKLVEQAPLPALDPLMIDEALETEPLRGSAPPPESSSEEDTATTQPSSNIDQPPMPRVHNDETTQTDLNCDEQTTSTQNTAAEKPLDHAYVVVPSPPETVDQPFLPSPDILATH